MTVKGSKQLSTNLKSIQKQLSAPRNKIQIITPGADFQVKHIKQSGPDDTGEMERSTRTKPDSEGVQHIKIEVDYAVFIEFGTSEIAPRAPMRKAAIALKGDNNTKKEMANELVNVLNKSIIDKP